MPPKKLNRMLTIHADQGSCLISLKQMARIGKREANLVKIFFDNYLC